MKTMKFLSATVAFCALLFVSSCENTLFEGPEKDLGILPASFKVDIPKSLSNSQFKSTLNKSTAMDTINGNHIYWYLNAFIAVGENAADLVESIIWHIAVYKIDRVISLTYTSNDDNRVKNLQVISDVSYLGREWEYQLTITDALSESNDDGGVGMQVFWNRQPVEGIAILKPYHLDRNRHEAETETVFSVEYNEAGNENYDAYMIVEAAGLPVDESDVYAPQTMRMFAGKKGEFIDLYGNTNHPNAWFNYFDKQNKGFNWAFVASGNETTNLGVAEVGLPASRADISSRNEILAEQSIRSVLTREMTNYVVSAYASVGITLQSDEISRFIAPYLVNAEAPGYFNDNGFVQGGQAPGDEFKVLEGRIALLTPFNPKTISDLEIDFRQ